MIEDYDITCFKTKSTIIGLLSKGKLAFDHS